MQARIAVQPTDVISAGPFDKLVQSLWRLGNTAEPFDAARELVQNSIDAQAKHITVRLAGRSGNRRMEVLDDGEGVFPEMKQDEALKCIGFSIGYSHKSEKAISDQVVGEFGVGLMGFSSFGETLTVETARRGDKIPFKFELSRQEDLFKVDRRASFLPSEYSTRVTVKGVKNGFYAKFVGALFRKSLQKSLGGQIRNTGVEITIVDANKKKSFTVAALAYEGQQIKLAKIQVPGHTAKIKPHIFLKRTGTEEGLMLCSRHVRVDDFSKLVALDLARYPFTDSRITGEVDWLLIQPTATRTGLDYGAKTTTAFVKAFLKSPVEDELVAALAADDAKEEEKILKEVNDLVKKHCDLKLGVARQRGDEIQKHTGEGEDEGPASRSKRGGGGEEPREPREPGEPGKPRRHGADTSSALQTPAKYIYDPGADWITRVNGAWEINNAHPTFPVGKGLASEQIARHHIKCAEGLISSFAMATSLSPTRFELNPTAKEMIIHAAKSDASWFKEKRPVKHRRPEQKRARRANA